MYSLVSIGIYVFAFLIIYAQLSSLEPYGIKDKKGQMSIKAVLFLAVFAFIIRICVAPYTAGHPTDMKCWTYWGSRLYSLGPQNFYADGVFADYPPGYMYILWLIGSIVGFTNAPGGLVLALYKLPGIIGDICLAFVIYNIARKHWSGKIASVLFFITAFNPLSYFNSVLWGQMDSLLILFTLISLYALYEEKYTKSAVFIVIAALLKPQALMFAPIYLFALISKKDIKLILKTVLICLAMVIAIAYPFSPAHQGNEGLFLRLLKALNPLWLVQKYASTLGSYNYASVNAFNFPALIGGNWKDASTPFLFLPWKVWGYITITFAIAFSGVLYFKLKDKAAKIFVPAFFIIAFLFAFGTKMHERYIYPAIIFTLILYIFTKKRAFLWLFAAESVVNLINLEYVFYCASNGNIAPAQAYITLISLAQLGIIITIFYTIYHTYFKKSNILTKKVEINENMAVTKTDWKFIGITTILYAIIAFSNLGDTSAPQTFTESGKADSFTVELSEETEIKKIAYYYGISDVASPASLSVSYSTDGENWNSINNECILQSVFKWDYLHLDRNAKYIRFTPNTSDYSIGEIGFLAADGNTAKIKDSYYEDKTSAGFMFDEQNTVPIESTYKNGTYFDEIYHPRSAYELLNGMDYYETTHPPLGKILISLGISIFGMTPFGWRVMGTLFGVLMLPALYILLKKLFKKSNYAFMGTILFAADFMHYSLTRMGTIDSYPVFFIILMYLAMYVFTSNLRYNIQEYGKNFMSREKRKSIYIPLLICGISTGLGIASKWIAVYSVIGLAVLFFAELYFSAKAVGFKSKEFVGFLKCITPYCILCFIAIPFSIYLLSYIPVANSQGKGLFEAMWDSQKYMLDYHGNLNATHPYSSSWYEWPVVRRPLLAYYQSDLGTHSHAAITIMGNPLIWWSGIGAFFYSVYRGIKTRSRTVLFIIIGLLSQLLPWVFVTRCTFIYHFFASVPFMIMLIIYSIKELYNQHPKFKYIAITFCIICVLAFILFYPVLTGISTLDIYTDSVLKWFNSWVF